MIVSIKDRTNLTGSSEAERSLRSCPELGLRALSPWVGQALGAQGRAHDLECSNSFETRQQLEGADSEDCVPVAGGVSPLVCIQHPLPGWYWWASQLRPRGSGPLSSTYTYLKFKEASLNPFLVTSGKLGQRLGHSIPMLFLYSYLF